jgi:hypothetical protein
LLAKSVSFEATLAGWPPAYEILFNSPPLGANDAKFSSLEFGNYLVKTLDKEGYDHPRVAYFKKTGSSVMVDFIVLLQPDADVQESVIYFCDSTQKINADGSCAGTIKKVSQQKLFAPLLKNYYSRSAKDPAVAMAGHLEDLLDGVNANRP